MRFEPYLLVLALALLLAGPAFGQLPPARSPTECDLVAEMVLTARALDNHGIVGAQAASLMADFYVQQLTGPHAERAGLYVAAAMKLAARNPDAAPLKLAQAVGLSCRINKGDINPIFGVDL